MQRLGSGLKERLEAMRLLASERRKESPVEVPLGVVYSGRETTTPKSWQAPSPVNPFEGDRRLESARQQAWAWGTPETACRGVLISDHLHTSPLPPVWERGRDEVYLTASNKAAVLRVHHWCLDCCASAHHLDLTYDGGLAYQMWARSVAGRTEPNSIYLAGSSGSGKSFIVGAAAMTLAVLGVKFEWLDYLTVEQATFDRWRELSATKLKSPVLIVDDFAYSVGTLREHMVGRWDELVRLREGRSTLYTSNWLLKGSPEVILDHALPAPVVGRILQATQPTKEGDVRRFAFSGVDFRRL